MNIDRGSELSRVASFPNLPLPTPREERLAFRGLRFRIAVTRVTQALTQSRLRVAVVVVLSVILWLAIYFAFREGFQLIDQIVADRAFHDRLMSAMFNVFFLSLTVMLTISSAIIAYSLLYRGEDMQFLLTTPASVDRVIAHKFQEVALISSWGFLMLCSPLLLAYGITANSHWPYYLVALPFILAFAVIPAALGTLLCMAIARFVPSSRVVILTCTVAATMLLACVGGWYLLGANRFDLMSPLWFDYVLGKLRFGQVVWLPSYWLTGGLFGAAARASVLDHALARDCLGFLAVLVANALMASQVLMWVAKAIFVDSYSRLAGSHQRRAGRFSVSGFDRWLLGCGWPLSQNMRLMLIKDFRLFRRDPLQWSQFFIFVGLLGLYFVNMRRFGDRNSLVVWTTILSFLNLAAVGLIIATFTTRFIFPMISLEGRRFWILGTLPIHQSEILWSKFLFACTVTSLPCCMIVLATDMVLGIAGRSPTLLFVHLIASLVMCLGLSSLAVGLGARAPDFREESSAKIAAGFDGTVNLLASAVYVLTVTLLTAIPCCLKIARDTAQSQLTASHPVPVMDWGNNRSILWGTLLALLIGGVVTATSMRAGLKAFRKLEF